MKENMIPEIMDGNDKYANTAIRWLDKGSHYELIFTDDFEAPPDDEFFDRKFTLPRSFRLADVIADMKNADTGKEVHIFTGLFSFPFVAVRLVLQQLLRFDYRVGYHVGTTSFCGWVFLFACQERYVSRYSSICYRDLSGSDNCARSLLGDRRKNEFDGVIGAEKILTAEELERSRTDDVWLSGEELIKRGAAMLYKQYATRKTPTRVSDVMEINGMLYRRTGKKFVKYAPTKDEPVSYEELLKLCNAPAKSEER